MQKMQDAQVTKSLNVISSKISQCASYEHIPSTLKITGLKILGNVAHIYFLSYCFFWQHYNFMHFDRHFAFQNA